MNYKTNKLYKFILVSLDFVILFFSFYWSYQLRFQDGIPMRNLDPFYAFLPWFFAALLTIFYFFDLYSLKRVHDLQHFLYSIFLAEGLFILVLISLSFWLRGFAIPRSVIVLSLLFHFLLTAGIRTVFWFIYLRVRGKKKVIIIGSHTSSGLQAAEKFLLHSEGWYQISSFFTTEQKEKAKPFIEDADLLFLSAELSKQEKEEWLSLSMNYGKEVLLVPDLYELFVMGAEIQQVQDTPVFSIYPPGLNKSEELAKRLLDFVISVILLILSSPVFLVLLIVIPLTSVGGAIYKQERLGKNEKPFFVYKFRSMIQDAEGKTGPMLATEKDPRITPIGRWIRDTRLDELPQLWNILKGDMSLVGPRPERAFFIEQFKEQLPDYRYRMVVKPGLTGLAQVRANYSTDVKDKLRYDLMYIRNYSLLLDLKILFQTVIVVLRKEQAKGVTSNFKNQLP